MPSAQRPPSSCLMAAMAATHGVYSRQNTRSDTTESGVSAARSCAVEPNRTDSVATTISFAMKPAMSAVVTRQSAKPRGEKIGAIQVAMAARIDSCASLATVSAGVKYCRNHTTTAAANTTVNARCRKSLVFSHMSMRTDFALGRR